MRSTNQHSAPVLAPPTCHGSAHTIPVQEGGPNSARLLSYGPEIGGTVQTRWTYYRKRVSFLLLDSESVLTFYRPFSRLIKSSLTFPWTQTRRCSCFTLAPYLSPSLCIREKSGHALENVISFLTDSDTQMRWISDGRDGVPVWDAHDGRQESGYKHRLWEPLSKQAGSLRKHKDTLRRWFYHQKNLDIWTVGG